MSKDINFICGLVFPSNLSIDHIFFCYIHTRHMSVILVYTCGIKGVTFNHRNRLCMLELMLHV